MIDVPQIAAGASYTATEVVTIITAIGILITAVGGVIVNIIATFRNGRKTEENGRKTDQLMTAVIGNETNQGLVNQVKEVHTLTNANMTAATNQITLQNSQIEALKAIILELKGERDKKAEVTATAAAKAEPAKPLALATAPETKDDKTKK